jgi:hypothetical protein
MNEEANESIETTEAEAKPAAPAEKVEPTADAEALGNGLSHMADTVAHVVGNDSQYVANIRELSAQFLDGRQNANVTAAVERGDL